MELLQLKYFCKVAVSQHITNTANEERISPSSLSATIKKLESEVGYSLFDRVGRNLKLNHNGEIFYEYVSASLILIQSGISEVHSLNCKEAFLTIILGNPHLWHSILQSFQIQYPNIHLRIEVTSDLKEILSMFFDFYLGNVFDIVTMNLEYHQLYPAEHYFVIMNKKHPLANRTSLDLQELKNETFFSFYKTEVSKYNHNMQLYHEAGIHPKLVEGDYLTRYKLLQNNECIAISTDLGLKNNFPDIKEFSIIPLSSQINFPRTQAIAWHKNVPIIGYKQVFYNYLLHKCSP